MKCCAVIPAAGRGTRLGLDRPKILAPLTATETIWSVLKRKLLAVADHVHVVLSPEGAETFGSACEADLASGHVSISIQPAPIGMGDAVFRGYGTWSKADIVLVIWGDQVFVSHETLAGALALHADAARTVVLPVVSLPTPYVEYVFDASNRLCDVRQSREGDRCQAGGLNDVGTFIMSVGGLDAAWNAYAAQSPRGQATGEVNFLPFLTFLSRSGWNVLPYRVDDPREARGINSPDDLTFFQELYRG